MADTSFGRYRLQALLGEGGMGQVWRAYDTETSRTVAVKVLPPHLAADKQYQERFRREAHAAAALNEPHIVPIHGFGEIDGRLYVDMRLIEGRDLGSILAEGPLDPAQAVNIVEQVAAALDSAHKIGLAHRDVKPSNILVGERDFVYLIDFGVARAATEARLTESGQAVGTPDYMAPERFDKGQADHRADIYALACVLYECLTGQRPFPGGTWEQQIAGHMFTAPPRPSEQSQALPPSFDNVVAKGLAKDPELRYQSTSELAAAARAALAHGAATVPTLSSPADAPTRLATRPRPWWKRHIIAVSAMIAGVVTTIAVVATIAIGAASESSAVNNDLGKVLLTATEADDIMGTSGMVPTARLTEPYKEQHRISPAECQAIAGNWEDQWEAANWLGYREMWLAGPLSDTMPTVDQVVVELPSTDDARRFVESRSKEWQQCLNKTVTRETLVFSLPEEPATFYDFAQDGDQITVFRKRPGEESGYNCQFVLTTAAEYLVNVRACKEDATNEAERISSKVLDRLRGQA